jgi:hypothetical protein
LFQQLSAKLLGSSALEALLARNAGRGAPPPQKQQALAFLTSPAAARPIAETVGKSMQRSTRETGETIMYEYAHIQRPERSNRTLTVVHQSYVRK